MMNDPSAELRAAAAARIKTARSEQGLNLYQLAARAGVNPESVSRAERGLRTASLDMAVKVATALGISPFDLMAPLDDED